VGDINLVESNCSPTMEVIKKRLISYKDELEAAIDRAERSELQLKEHKARADKAESEVSALSRRIQLLEEDLERSEERLKISTLKLDEVTQVADESERMRKMLEHRATVDSEKMEVLEKSLQEARLLAEDSDRKYDEVARKLALAEASFERAEERARLAEKKKGELEEELKIIGNNLRTLELKEEKSLQNQQAYELAIKVAKQRLHEAESRAESADRTVQKLQKEVDRLEDALLSERGKYQHMSDELDQTYSELTAH